MICAAILQTHVSVVIEISVFVDGHVLDVKWHKTRFNSIGNCHIYDVNLKSWKQHILMAQNINFMFRSCIRSLKYFMRVAGQWCQVSSAKQGAPTPALPTFHDQASTHNVLGCSSSLDLYTEMRPHYDDVWKFVFSVCTVPKIIAQQMPVLFFLTIIQLWYDTVGKYKYLTCAWKLTGSHLDHRRWIDPLLTLEGTSTLPFFVLSSSLFPPFCPLFASHKVAPASPPHGL